MQRLKKTFNLFRAQFSAAASELPFVVASARCRWWWWEVLFDVNFYGVYAMHICEKSIRARGKNIEEINCAHSKSESSVAGRCWWFIEERSVTMMIMKNSLTFFFWCIRFASFSCCVVFLWFREQNYLLHSRHLFHLVKKLLCWKRL